MTQAIDRSEGKTAPMESVAKRVCTIQYSFEKGIQAALTAIWVSIDDTTFSSGEVKAVLLEIARCRCTRLNSG